MSNEVPLKRRKGNPFIIRLFDPKIISEQYKPGDAVYCRDRQRRGRLVKQDNSDEWYIQYKDTSRRHQVSLKRLLPIYSKQSLMTILVTSDTIYYRQLATSQTTKEDKVLEIGCSTGKTSEILSKQASSYVGFDTSKTMVEETLVKIRSESSVCHQVDALKDPTLAQELACQSSEPSIVFMDIGGNRELVGVIRMLHWIMNSFSNVRLVVVKSKALFDTVRGDCNQKGILKDSETWLERQHTLARAATLPRHPLQAPKMANPATGTLICRYHNYHAKGCFKGSDCPYDHKHCHICLERGHIARNCPLVQEQVRREMRAS